MLQLFPFGCFFHHNDHTADSFRDGGTGRKFLRQYFQDGPYQGGFAKAWTKRNGNDLSGFPFENGFRRLHELLHLAGQRRKVTLAEV